MFEPFKLIGGPGSRGFLALCFGIGIFIGYVWPGRPRLGQVWLLIVFVSYLVIGTPAVALSVADALSSYHPIPVLTYLPPVDTIVLLAGDNVVGRVREAVRAHDAWPKARIVVFGDDWPFDQLLKAGIPRDQTAIDPSSANTVEQMTAVRDRLCTNQSGAVAIVASRLQMPRVAALAETMQLHVTLLPSPADEEPSRVGVARWIPRYTALRITRDALYEGAAFAYYRWKGYIKNGGNVWTH